jgi:polysaccharide export outer membrane protein
VNHPGRTELLAPHRLLDVLESAGGETPLASSTIEIRRHVALTEKDESELIHYKRGSSPDRINEVLVNPGDTVVVHRAGIVYVLGAVTRPGGYLMQEDGGLNSNEALALAQGMVLQASVHTARVIRQMPDGSLVEIPIKFAKGMKAKAQPIQLQPRDIVYVDQSLGKNILTTAKSIVGSATSAVIYAYK